MLFFLLRFFYRTSHSTYDDQQKRKQEFLEDWLSDDRHKSKAKYQAIIPISIAIQ